MEVSGILTLIKGMPEGITAIVVLIVLCISLFLKRKDVDLSQITSIGELQTKQLKTLIEQNVSLSEELRLVRLELSEAYKVIDDMRLRITELEQLVANGQFVTNGQFLTPESFVTNGRFITKENLVFSKKED